MSQIDSFCLFFLFCNMSLCHTHIDNKVQLEKVICVCVSTDELNLTFSIANYLVFKWKYSTGLERVCNVEVNCEQANNVLYT